MALTFALLHLGGPYFLARDPRAPWCGLQIADLHELAAQEHKSIIWDALQKRWGQLRRTPWRDWAG